MSQPRQAAEKFCFVSGHGFSRAVKDLSYEGFIDTCINNVLIQAHRERTVVDEGAQQIFVVL